MGYETYTNKRLEDIKLSNIKVINKLQIELDAHKELRSEINNEQVKRFLIVLRKGVNKK